jgi:hypothetical protein
MDGPKSLVEEVYGRKGVQMQGGAQDYRGQA